MGALGLEEEEGEAEEGHQVGQVDPQPVPPLGRVEGEGLTMTAPLYSKACTLWASTREVARWARERR